MKAPVDPRRAPPPVRPVTVLGALGLAVLCLAVYLPGFFALPPVDRDESRFAQASRQMLESVALPPSARDPVLHAGGLVVPRVQGRERLNKPPLTYWLQGLSAGVFTLGRPFRDAIWMYRVPSLIAAIVTVLITWRLGTSLFDSRTGRLAAALLACCGLVAWEARQARADMVLLAFSTAGMFALWRIWSSRGAAPAAPEVIASGVSTPTGPRPFVWPLVFWTALSLGVMTKGPITPLVVAVTALSLSVVARRWRWLVGLRFELGIPVFLALVGPWVIAVGERVGWSAYLRTIADESLGRVASAPEGHWGPPGYHTVLLPVLFWPGSLMTAAGVALAVRQGLTFSARGTGVPPGSAAGPFRRALARVSALRPAHAPYFFCLAWLLPAWLIFELMATKLPHYTLPMYPAIAILSARTVLAADAGLLPGLRSRAGRLARGVWLAIGALLCVGVPIGVAGIDFNLGDRRWWFAVIGVITMILASANLLVARRSFQSAQWTRAQAAGLVAFIVIAVLAIGVMIPRATPLWISPRLATLIADADPERRRPIAAVGFHEDSLVFLTRGRATRVADSEIGAWFRDHPDGVAVVPLSLSVAGTEQIGTVSGFNYSKGRVERCAVIRGLP